MNNFLRLWSFLRPKRKLQLFILVLLMFISAFAELVSIGAFIPFVTALTNPEQVLKAPYLEKIFYYFQVLNLGSLFYVLAFLFSFAVLFSLIVKVFVVFFQSRICYSIGHELSVDIFSKALHQPYITHISRNSSDIITSLANRVNVIVNQIVIPLLTIFSSLLVLIVLLAGLLYYQTSLTLLSFSFFGFIYFLILYFTRKKIKLYSIIQAAKENFLIMSLQEALGGIRDILLDGSQEVYIKRYKKNDFNLRRVQSNIQILTLSPRYLIESLGLIFLCFLALFIFEGGNKSVKNIGVLAVLALVAQRLLPLLQQVYASVIAIRSNYATLLETLKLLNPLILKGLNDGQSLKFNFQIKVVEVSFSYSHDSLSVLNNVNLTISKGDRVGIIGQTGCGKSTFLDVLMGLLTPLKGEIRVDEQLINTENVANFQSIIAHVPQQIFLTDSSILENIAFGVPKQEINYEKVVDAARKAQLDDFVHTLHKGYETNVGERGVKLSGGQRQRIGIARALYKDAQLIIFDEATSSLDADTEIDVMDSIYSLDKYITFIIVAHRHTTLKKCNKIVEFSNGSVKRVCNYLDL
jgi:ABC-type multidrug transport system fused ATPase/permease subunit